ncbi:MAG: hypothetical protein KC550_06295, partial [Nanoarchaeota archaeon]|nr:hypothetical protein [Nanoarchaeota archaeon]
MTKGSKNKRKQILEERRNKKEERNRNMKKGDNWEEKKRVKQNKRLENILGVESQVIKLLEGSDYVTKVDSERGIISYRIPDEEVKQYGNSPFISKTGISQYEISDKFNFVFKVGDSYFKKEYIVEPQSLPKVFEEKVLEYFRREHGYL